MRIKTPGYTDFLLLLTLSAIFGTSFLFTRIAVRDMPPLTVAASRLLIALLLMYPLMRFNAQKLPVGWRIWIVIAAASFFGNALPFALITWGQVNVNAGMTAILMAIMPLITVVLAHVTTRDERMNRYKLLGVLTGLVGVVVLMGWEQLGTLGDDMVRQYAIAAGACSYAVNAIITKQLTVVPRLAMITALMLASVLFLLPVSLLVDQPWTVLPSAASMWSIVALAIGPTAVATMLILNIIGRQGASFLSQINFMVPLFGVFFGAVFLAERLPPNAWIALVIILGGIAVSRIGNRLGSGEEPS